MKIKELSELLNGLAITNPDMEVIIALDEPSVGTIAHTHIKGVGVGFDWEMGNFIIFPEDPIVRATDIYTNKGKN